MEQKMQSIPQSDTVLRHLLAPFRPFLDSPTITEIAVNRPGRVFVEDTGEWKSFDVPELTYEKLIQLGVTNAKFAGENVVFESTVPILSAVMPDGERAQYVMPPACREECVSLTIRKPSKRILQIDDFVASGFFDKVKPPSETNEIDGRLLELFQHIHDVPHAAKNRANFLKECVLAGKNIVIAGETGSGKTTFMKALMQCIPTSERIITIEDVPELLYGLPHHENQVNLFYPSEGKATATVTAASLLRSCLRMKPDRILLAELRGGETYDFLNVCMSGHKGSITSCHAGSCAGVFEYLALKVLQSETGKSLSYDVIRKLLYLTIDVVVHIRNERGFGRHITEIWFDPSSKRAYA